MLQEVIGGLVDCYPASGHVLVDLPFSLLPMLLPKPRLIGWHGKGWPELQDAVGSLGDLKLGPGLV